MQSVAYFTILVAFASLALGSSQPEQPIQSGPVSVVESVQVVPGQQQQQQQAPVVGNSPVQQPPQSSVVVVESQQVGGGVVPIEHQQFHHQHHHQQPQQHSPGASYYAPAGLIQVVGSEQQQQHHQVNKPGMVRSVEQYGQPEPASLPPNYKPFGSWGLYIGGNPADGYYTDYYKHLSSSVEKQQQQQQQLQSGEQQGSAKPISALSPMLKQAGGSPFAGGDYYPFAYSMNDLSSVSRTYQPVVEQAVPQQQPQQVVPVSPVQVGAQVYGSPASFETNHYGVSPYADSYATKKVGSSTYGGQKEAPRAIEQQPQSGKGYQSRVYVYPAQASPLASPMVPQQQQQQYVQQYQPQQQQQQAHSHQQVVAYPVPVSSQIVGSQAGVDGAFAPYGVHAFTRYSVKPTMVSGSESSAGYHYGVSSQLPTYKQHSAVYSQQVSAGPNQGTHYYQPLSYYGYPLSQLHYSQGSIVPAVHGGEMHHNPAVSQVEAASEKSETTAAEDKSAQVSHSAGSGSSSSSTSTTNNSHKQHQAAQSQKRA